MNPLEKIFRRLESKDISAEEEKKLRAILDGVAEKLSDRMVAVIREEENAKPQ